MNSRNVPCIKLFWNFGSFQKFVKESITIKNCSKLLLNSNDFRICFNSNLKLEERKPTAQIFSE